jgi:hypothetical protein
MTISVGRAGRLARDFVVSTRRDEGRYELGRWPDVARQARRPSDPSRAVARLRIGQRRLLGFLDPVEDALFLTAGLRRPGFPASFHLGRELVPAVPPAGFYAWVECDGEVLSTSVPVHEEYVRVHCSPEEPARC